jgi:type I site-specific restriction-modification system R (restriction) subunit
VNATLESDIEQAALDLFKAMGWGTANVMEEVLGEHGTLGRDTRGDVVLLLRRLRPALEELNQGAPAEAIDQAIEDLTRDRSAMSLEQANREIYRLLKDGVEVRVAGAEDEADATQRIRVIDWNEPKNNDYFVAQQLWVQGETYKRRTDLVGFVNGLPLVFIELKGLHSNVENAYRQNFRDYLGTIPQLFWFNAIVILSNGFKSRVGTITGEWDHFKEWKRIEREDEPPAISLEVMLRGVCDKARLCDLVENFTLFSEQKSSLAKIVGQNHQFLGVNKAIATVEAYQLVPRRARLSKEELEARKRLGVFWHTQGSGKSFSMVFFSQKILRKIPGNWTRQYHLITREERLDTIAGDIVTHFLGLPRGTKAMVVAIDKVTAVRMHDKVKATWARRRAEIQAKLGVTPSDDKKARQEIVDKVAFMDETSMAVVVSQSQNEIEAFKKKGLDIAPHRQRMIKEDLDTRFKDDKDALRIVFVCAMWITGFDVPSCGALYLDKPMKNHSLMQTIARANRVYEGKENGLIVDYVGVFRNLQKALAIYGSGSGGNVGAGDTPVQPKEVQLEELRTTMAAAKKFCTERGVDVDGAKNKKGFERLQRLRDGVDRLLNPAEVKKNYLDLAGRVDRL